eukprot:9330649-Prorocentrum_lima.AAC.1
MTSSLVGSEMCIRDRFSASSSGDFVVLRRRSFAACGAPRGAATPAPAVSYTHLTLPTICSV